MSETANRKRQFRCQHCNGLIVIPWGLPPTKGPCPHCGKEIESPSSPEAGKSGSPVKTPSPEAGKSGSPVKTPSPEAGKSGSPVKTSVPMPGTPRRQAKPTASRAEEPAPAPVSSPVPAASPMPTLGEDDLTPAAVRKLVELGEVPVAKAPLSSAGKKSVLRSEADSAKQSPFPRRGEPSREDRGELPGLRDKPILEEKRESRPRQGRLVAGLVALLLLAMALAAAIWMAREHFRAGPDSNRNIDGQRELESQQDHYLRIGWRDDARKTMESFVAARTVEGKALCSLGGTALLPEMTEFYGGEEIDDSDTPASAFSFYDLRPEDRERGLFLMIYDLPPGFELSEFFQPLATMEVKYGVGSPDMLLASFARARNFVRDPVRVQAFFKETPDGLKIDWHVFVQTKNRLYRSFLFGPTPGRREVFRVLVSEDVAEGGRGEGETRTYRLDDPIHAGDSTMVSVTADSEIGRILSKVNWRGGKSEKPVPKTATIELTWQGEDDPEIEISRFICWEFLGLGGKAGKSPGTKE